MNERVLIGIAIVAGVVMVVLYLVALASHNKERTP